MQIVVLYNEAAFKVTNAVVLDCQDRAEIESVNFILLGLDSVGSLDVSIGRERLTSAIPLLRASALTVQSRWDEAIALFDVYLADSSVHTTGRQLAKYLAERAYCKMNLHDEADALRDIEAALQSASSCCDMDDLFVLHSRVGQVLDAAGQASAAQSHRDAAKRCLESFAIDQQAIRDQLDPVIGDLHNLPPAWL